MSKETAISKEEIAYIEKDPRVQKVVIDKLGTPDVKWEDEDYKYYVEEEWGSKAEYIHIYTNEIYLRPLPFEHRYGNGDVRVNERRNLGKCRISIPISYKAEEMPLAAFDVDGNGKYIYFIEGNYHAHIFDSGIICMGSEILEIRNLILNREYYTVFEYVHRFLQQWKAQSYNLYPVLAKRPVQYLKDGKWS